MLLFFGSLTFPVVAPYIYDARYVHPNTQSISDPTNDILSVLFSMVKIHLYDKNVTGFKYQNVSSQQQNASSNQLGSYTRAL